MNSIELFEMQKYVKIDEVLDRNYCKALTDSFEKHIKDGHSVKDEQCEKSLSAYAFEEFEKLLKDLLPVFEKASGRRLIPTYSYARKYLKGEVLKNHIDRPACEISATLTLGYGNEPWSIYMGNHDKSVSSEICLEVGDAVLYKGEQVHHWREQFQGDWQVQVFLHYVDAEGKNTEWAYDKRSVDQLTPHLFEPEEQLYCFYNDILNDKACEIIINTYTQQGIERHAPFIGSSASANIDRSVRNVERIELPTYKEIGGRLAAVGLSANYNRWKFDISHSSQSEFLIYPPGGRYTTHMDTFMVPGGSCRKLTVIAFLNDTFEGGKFYLSVSNKKIYPPQNPGTVIVFPSFLPHGVEDILSGERYAVVCWMDGPWFK
jgi:predicted 2-oxoglutarate/Fe(II)-dependent dioxygenase YbiX